VGAFDGQVEAVGVSDFCLGHGHVPEPAGEGLTLMTLASLRFTFETRAAFKSTPDPARQLHPWTSIILPGRPSLALPAFRDSLTMV